MPVPYEPGLNWPEVGGGQQIVWHPDDILGVAKSIENRLKDVRAARDTVLSAATGAPPVGGWDVAVELTNSLSDSHRRMVAAYDAFIESGQAVIVRLLRSADLTEEAEAFNDRMFRTQQGRLHSTEGM
ncbi:hypothetical protein GCM10027589_25330 [Actinocorallia lasiicapitis]